MSAPQGRRRQFSVETLDSPEELAAVAESWDVLAEANPTPFATCDWLVAWWQYATRATQCVLLREPGGTICAGALVQHRPLRGVRGAADVHSGDWGVVAAGEHERDAVWRQLTELAHPVGRLLLPALDEPAVTAVRSALEPSGFHFVELGRLDSPAVGLPASYDDLLAGASRNLRSQLGRARRAMERLGTLTVRTAGPQRPLADDIERFLRLEASGWKGQEGTAILGSPRTARLYRDFAAAAFANGRLRLLLLELDGALVAADLSYRIGPRTALVKTTYDERYASLRPGLVLRGEALRAAVEEGSTEYDFLGGPDAYKLRWAGELRPRRQLLAVRGPWRVEAAYREELRPRLGRLHRWLGSAMRPGRPGQEDGSG